MDQILCVLKASHVRVILRVSKGSAILNDLHCQIVWHNILPLSSDQQTLLPDLYRFSRTDLQQSIVNS